MSKNPKKKKNIVHAPPAWALVNCPNSWIARTRRAARINFALTKFANVTGMFGKPLPGQRKQNRHQSSSAFHLWINFRENAGKAEKGFSKDTARYLGWWKWYLGCKCYLREGNVVFLLLVQMKNAGEQHGGRGKTDNGGPGLGKAVMMEGEEIKHFQNGWWPPKSLFNNIFIHRPRPSSEGCWSNRKTGESCQVCSLTNWSDKVKVDSYFFVKKVKSRIPILTWLPKYSLEWLVSDMIAGITVGLTVIPQVDSWNIA